MHPPNRVPRQLPLGLPVEPELYEAMVVKKARELFHRSRLLSTRYASFERVMAEPVTGRCLRMAAVALVRNGVGR